MPSSPSGRCGMPASRPGRPRSGLPGHTSILPAAGRARISVEPQLAENHGQPRRALAPSSIARCRDPACDRTATENPVDDYEETQGAAEPPHPRADKKDLPGHSQPGEAGPVRTPCPHTLPVTITDSIPSAAATIPVTP